MHNSARLQQLGLHAIPDIFARATGISKEKSKTNRKYREDSESEYDPLRDDDTAKEDDSESEVSKVITLPSYQGLSIW